MTGIATITQETIQGQIFTIRGKQVMMDRDLAVLYGVETKQLKRQVKRNIDRFPNDEFMFELTAEEYNSLRSQFGTLKRGEHVKYLPQVFGERGVLMLSSILRSESSVNVSIKIMTAFVEMRQLLKGHTDLYLRLNNVERKQVRTDENVEKIINALQNQDLKPKQGIFYNGQVFDAYTFIADVIRDAKSSIVLIDNYVDDTVFRLFAKRKKGIPLTIYTQNISAQLTLDLDKYNLQYGPAVIKSFKDAHDRFLILDGVAVYHIGASLKDLGKKWFAFSRMELSALDLLNKLN
jgi:hypothetical protein